MKINAVRFVILLAAVVIRSAEPACAAEPSKEDATLVLKLIGASEKLDYEAFVSDSVRAITKEQFEAVATKLAPRLQAGHELLYLGVLSQRGHRVTVWKLSFKDGSDDHLVTLGVKDGKVGSFLVR
jgi:hypothetical protein